MGQMRELYCKIAENAGMDPCELATFDTVAAVVGDAPAGLSAVDLFDFAVDHLIAARYETPDEERHTATDEELAAAVADTCREVEAAMVAGDIPRSVRSFGELHDFCDANCLASCCDEANPRAWWTVASYNALQGAVDARLAAGDFDRPSATTADDVRETQGEVSPAALARHLAQSASTPSLVRSFATLKCASSAGTITEAQHQTLAAVVTELRRRDVL